MSTEKQITDTDWLEFNASKLGMKPDWTWEVIHKDTYTHPVRYNEYTRIRKKIDERMKNE